jgi:hypothetical protein
MIKMKYCISLLFLTGLCLSCSAQSNWQLTSIPTGQKDFDSARLCYLTPERIGGMNLEFFKTNESVTAYLSTLGRRFKDRSGITRSPLEKLARKKQPDEQSPIIENTTKAIVQFKTETLEIPLIVHEGLMRVRLPDEITAKITSALQDGEAVTIMIGSTTQTFQPDHFSTLFNKLTRGSNSFFDSFQGTLP